MLMKILEHLVQNNLYVLSSENGYPNLNLNLNQVRMYKILFLVTDCYEKMEIQHS